MCTQPDRVRRLAGARAYGPLHPGIRIAHGACARRWSRWLWLWPLARAPSRWPGCRNVLETHGRSSGGASLRAWSTTSRLPRIAGHGRGVGAKRRLADRQRPLILLSCTFQARQAVGMDAPEPLAGHPFGHPAGPPSKMDTLAWPAGRRERIPRRTATATDRMPDAFFSSSAVVHPCGLAGEYE